MPSVEKALVIRHREIVPYYYELEFIAPSIAQGATRTICNVRVSDSLGPLLEGHSVFMMLIKTRQYYSVL